MNTDPPPVDVASVAPSGLRARFPRGGPERASASSAVGDGAAAKALLPADDSSRAPSPRGRGASRSDGQGAHDILRRLAARSKDFRTPSPGTSSDGAPEAAPLNRYLALRKECPELDDLAAREILSTDADRDLAEYTQDLDDAMVVRDEPGAAALAGSTGPDSRP